MHKSRATSLFLMELMISICFLSLTGAFCVRMFVLAHNISVHSYEQTQAVLQADSIEAAFRASGGDPGETADALAVLYQGGELAKIRSGKTLIVYFDRKFRPAATDSADKTYTAELSFTGQEGDTNRAALTIGKNGETLISRDLLMYAGANGSSADDTGREDRK